jgi:hypothetical protein
MLTVIAGIATTQKLTPFDFSHWVRANSVPSRAVECSRPWKREIPQSTCAETGFGEPPC